MFAGIFSAITAIPGLISGIFGTVNHITDALANEKIALLNATTDVERARIQENISTLTLRRDLMIQEGKLSRLNIYMRSLLALGPTAVLLKLFGWDKTVGPFFGCVGHLNGAAQTSCKMFTTDPLDANLWHVVMVVVGFYFLAETTHGIAKIMKGLKS